jgi:N-acetylmuramoyl-L-alanine amidase
VVMVLGTALEAALREVGLELVTRAEAGLRPPDYRNAMPTPSPRFYDHHAAVESTDDAQEWRAHQAFHMDSRGWSDIAYNFGIPDPNPSKIVFEGRGVGVQGGHTQGENTESHAFCVLGNFEVDQPSANTLEVAAQLMALGIRKKWWDNHILGHRDAAGASTSCPGKYWYAKLPWLRDRVNQILAGQPTPTPVGETSLLVLL